MPLFYKPWGKRQRFKRSFAAFLQGQVYLFTNQHQKLIARFAPAFNTEEDALVKLVLAIHLVLATKEEAQHPWIAALIAALADSDAFDDFHTLQPFIGSYDLFEYIRMVLGFANRQVVEENFEWVIERLDKAYDIEQICLFQAIFELLFSDKSSLQDITPIRQKALLAAATVMENVKKQADNRKLFEGYGLPSDPDKLRQLAASCEGRTTYSLNPYFRETDNLFRQAITTMYEEDVTASLAITMEAFSRDPYRTEMYIELAFYYAALKNLDRFKEYLLICRRNYREGMKELLANPVVVNAFPANVLADILSTGNTHYLNWQRRFTAIDPAGLEDQVLLQFKAGHKKEIETTYQSINADVRKYLNLDQPGLTGIDHFVLMHNSDRVYADASEIDLVAAIKKLAPHLKDVRFLIYGEQEANMDEVAIRNGLFHLYRHDLEDDFMETRVAYFKDLADRYNDVKIREWLMREYPDEMLQ